MRDLHRTRSQSPLSSQLVLSGTGLRESECSACLEVTPDGGRAALAIVELCNIITSATVQTRRKYSMVVERSPNGI